MQRGCPLPLARSARPRCCRALAVSRSRQCRCWPPRRPAAGSDPLAGHSVVGQLVQAYPESRRRGRRRRGAAELGAAEVRRAGPGRHRRRRRRPRRRHRAADHGRHRRRRREQHRGHRARRHRRPRSSGPSDATTPMTDIPTTTPVPATSATADDHDRSDGGRSDRPGDRRARGGRGRRTGRDHRPGPGRRRWTARCTTSGPAQTDGAVRSRRRDARPTGWPPPRAATTRPRCGTRPRRPPASRPGPGNHLLVYLSTRSARHADLLLRPGPGRRRPGRAAAGSTSRTRCPR